MTDRGGGLPDPYYGPQPAPTHEWWHICDSTGAPANEGTYQRGCRCPECREAHRLYRKSGKEYKHINCEYREPREVPIRTITNPYGDDDARP